MRITYADGMRSLAGLPTSRQKVERLEVELIARGEIVDFPVENHFAPGMYIRKLTIPKGHVLTGAAHTTQHTNIVAKGRIAVETADGVREFVAGDVLVSPPGTKRAGYALEDSVWVTVHHNPTDETDMRKLVEIFTESKFDDLLEARQAALVSQTKMLEGG